MCVVGAGVAGLSTALALVKEGLHVVVLEAAGVCAGETARSTAQVSWLPEERFLNFERTFGRETGGVVIASYREAISQVQAWCSEYSIECDLHDLDGYVIAGNIGPESSDELNIINDELEACQRLGVLDAEVVAQVPWMSFDSGPALRLPHQAALHPIQYVEGLAEAFVRAGGELFCSTRVREYSEGDSIVVQTETGLTVAVRELVLATNSPINRNAVVHNRQIATRTFLIACPIAKGSLSDIFLWDTASPYHYVRLYRGEPGRDILLVGGEDIRTGAEDDGVARLDALENWVRERFPVAGEVVSAWSGQVMNSVDRLPLIGLMPGCEHVHLVSGDSGSGFVHTTLAAGIIRNLILGREDPLARIYSPLRLSRGLALRVARQGADAAARYSRKLAPSDCEIEEIAPGKGATVRRGLNRFAIYRDATGEIHPLRAVCSHLGCPVTWNSLEQSWDCPCHGSRFRAGGEVLCGPATKTLEDAAGQFVVERGGIAEHEARRSSGGAGRHPKAHEEESRTAGPQ